MGEDAGEVVDPVEGEGGEDGIVGFGGEGKGLSWWGEHEAFVRREECVEGCSGVAIEEGWGCIGRGEVCEASCERGRGGGEGAGYVAGIGAEVEDLGEVSVYVLCV